MVILTFVDQMSIKKTQENVARKEDAYVFKPDTLSFS